jgi:hypothetical protein
MIDGTDASAPDERPTGESITELRGGEAAVPAQRPEPPTNVMPMPVAPPPAEPTSEPLASEPPVEAAEPPTRMMAPLEPLTSAPSLNGQEPSVRSQPPATEDEPAPSADAGSVWPGLTAAGLPTRVPRQGDEDTIKEAFFESWEAAPTTPTPLTRQPFAPRYLDEPPRQRPAWNDDYPPVPRLATEPPEPKEPPAPPQPPDPAEPPEPPEPPEPKEPPAPPAPPPPSPFPSPTPYPTPPYPTPPEPVPPVPGPNPPIPPGPPVPAPPPGPPVPPPPAPFPPPPGPVPPPPAMVPGPAVPVIVPGLGRPTPTTPLGPPTPTFPTPPVLAPIMSPGRQGATSYQGGNYGELSTEPITGVTAAAHERAVDRSGSLTGHLLSREMYDRRERRRQMKSVLWVAGGLLAFGIFIAIVVTVLAGDFIAGLFETFSRWAG